MLPRMAVSISTFLVRIRPMTDFTLVVLPMSFASGVSGTLDVLQAAAVLAPRSLAPTPTWRVLSPSGGMVSLSAGMQIATEAMPRRPRRDASTWILPGLGLESAEALASGLTTEDSQTLIRALAAHANRGGRTAASCSAVFLLQAAGLLPRRRVTTSWWLAAELQRLEPSCLVDAGRMVCADGPVTTAGAAFAHTDLMLHVLRARFGTALADAVARALLIDGREAQAPFVVPNMLSNGNELIARLVKRLEAALPHPPSIQALASEFAVSQRTLSRHVREATGQSTKALVQSVRLHRARRLIESSRMSIEGVAEQLGYKDATALRRLMHKSTGANPSRFRPSVLRPRTL